MTEKIIKILLIFQGLYWSITGLWALVALDHFSRVTGLHREGLHVTDRFEMYSISTLAVVLGLFFIWGARKKEFLKPTAILALSLAIAVIIPELIYLPQMKDMALFWLDFAEEITFTIVIGLALFVKQRSIKS